MNPTGCPRRQAISRSGCAPICPVRPFSTASISCLRSRRCNDVGEEKQREGVRAGRFPRGRSLVAGEYLISGPGWIGTVPQGMTQISSPNNAVHVIGRVLVENDSDLPTAYGLAKQIQFTPLSQR
jgi:hypothetical protein